MKTRILTSLIISLFCWNTSAQTADDWVAQGRADLVSHDIVGANACFGKALSLNPTHQNANALYAVTRLLVLPSQPVGSNFLTRISFPIAGRNIYAWTSAPPKDANGLWLAPAGVSAQEFVSQFRTNILLSVDGAIGNLSAITDTNFTLNLTGGETAITDVTVDYGDLKLIQAGLFAAEYAIYTLNAQNLDAQLTAIRSLYTNGTLSAQEVLSDYPELFTFATTNDLRNTLAAFTNAINAYFKASAFIRSRPAGEVRLFNYDQLSSDSEGRFRLVLQDLKNSLLVGPQFLALDPDLIVDMSSQFYYPETWRSLFPQFDGNAIALGSFPDVTFGGAVYGLATEDVESYASHYFKMLSVGGSPFLLAGNTVNLTFTTLRGHYYALEVSSNLVDWQVLGAFTASNAVSVLADSPRSSSRFYRLRDDTGFMAFSGVVLDLSTSLPIAGAQVQSLDDGTISFTDSQGQFYLATTLPTSWYGDDLEISAPGYATGGNWYYGGGGLASGLQIYLAVPPANDNFASQIVLTGSTLSTNGNNFTASWETDEPYDNYYNGGYGHKSVWFAWAAPATHSYVVSVSTTNGYYNPILAIYTGTQLSTLATVTNVTGDSHYADYTLDATAGQTYQIEVDDYYHQGGAYTLTIAP
jgi:hypothetical protein